MAGPRQVATTPPREARGVGRAEGGTRPPDLPLTRRQVLNAQDAALSAVSGNASISPRAPPEWCVPAFLESDYWKMGRCLDRRQPWHDTGTHQNSAAASSIWLQRARRSPRSPTTWASASSRSTPG